MKMGNKWNWTWAFLAIILGFSTLVFYLIGLCDLVYTGLPYRGVALYALPLFVWTAMLAHGIPLTVAIALCFTKRFSAILGYGNAFLLSFIGLPMNLTFVVILARSIHATSRPLLIVAAAMAMPLILMGFAIRDPKEKMKSPYNAAVVLEKYGI